MDRLSTLARETVEAPPVPPSPLRQLRSRATARRRHRRVAIASASALVVLGAFVVAVDARSDGRASVTTPAHPQPHPTITVAPTARPTPTTLAVPGLVTPHDQVTAPWPRERAPVAVGGGFVWVGTDDGVSAIDPETMETVGEIPTDLPPVILAATGDGLWVLTGSADYPRGSNDSDLPPYRLLLVNPASRRATLDVELPFRSSFPASRNVRMAASAGQTWVAQGSQLVRVDARTGAVEGVDLGGQYVGHLAADDNALWVVSAGTTGRGVAQAGLLHVEAGTHTVQGVPGIAPGQIWDVASSGDTVWVASVVVDQGSPRVALSRVEKASWAITRYDLPAISIVSGGGRLWAQLSTGDRQSLTDPGGAVSEIDLTSGSVIRSIRIAPSDPGQSAGYTAPPFAIDEQGRIWTAAKGVQRTTP